MVSSPRIRLIVSRLTFAWRDALASAIAAGIAWVLAVWLLGHPRPLFAAISAIVCLSPGLPSHGRQAVGLMLGVTTGIVIGELSLLLPEGMLVPEGLSLLRLASATFLSVVIAASFGQPAVVPIQAGVSAVLVLALGPESAGLTRMADVAIGVGAGLFFSQILLTPDPVRLVGVAADDLLIRLAHAFRDAAGAFAARDVVKAETALSAFSSAHGSLIALDAGIESARYAARWSIRGRLGARAVADMAARYDRRATRLYASSLLFGEALANALRKDSASTPADLEDIILEAGERCKQLAAAAPAPASGKTSQRHPAEPDIWASVRMHIGAVSTVLGSIEDLAREPGEPAGRKDHSASR